MSNSSHSARFGIGSIIAGILSWQLNHSILWCILHVIFGWFYVIYYMIAHVKWS